ncbi:hypothetical protein MNBD_NITROSPINAE04-1633 [hydrothermal vent metagenome]|uniref:DUF4124 domain-containing protein n=1 Tax=hydrothermal vent metagenome TaxID=652676 RepID=A0A3B1CJE9_9ZZZZ
MVLPGYIKSIRLIGFVTALLLLALPGLSYSQVYKWVDENGNVQYTDQPRALKTAPPPGKKRVIPPRDKEQISPAEYYGFEKGKEKEPAEVKSAPDKAREDNDARSPGAKAIVMVGDLKIQPSLSGRALVVAKIKNQSSQPVAGIRLDVIVFKKDRTRGADLAIPFTGGKKRPDQLNPGETGAFEYEINLDPKEVAGYRSRLVWAYGDIAAPPGKGKKAPEGVQELIRNKKTGEIRKAGEKPGSGAGQKK